MQNMTGHDFWQKAIFFHNARLNFLSTFTSDTEVCSMYLNHLICLQCFCIRWQNLHKCRQKSAIKEWRFCSKFAAKNKQLTSNQNSVCESLKNVISIKCCRQKMKSKIATNCTLSFLGRKAAVNLIWRIRQKDWSVSKTNNHSFKNYFSLIAS